jgi:hypothetical protein
MSRSDFPWRSPVRLPRPAPGTGRWWVVGGVGISLAVAYVVWLGLGLVGAVRPVVTGFAVSSPSSASIEYDVHRPAGVAVRCVLTALDVRKGRVGTLEDLIPAGPQTLGPSVGEPADLRAGHDRRRRLVRAGELTADARARHRG